MSYALTISLERTALTLTFGWCACVRYRVREPLLSLEYPLSRGAGAAFSLTQGRTTAQGGGGGHGGRATTQGPHEGGISHSPVQFSTPHGGGGQPAKQPTAVKQVATIASSF